MLLTVAELAVYLGVTPSGVRQIIRRNGIKPVSRRWKAHLYRPADVLQHADTFDRLAS